MITAQVEYFIVLESAPRLCYILQGLVEEAWPSGHDCFDEKLSLLPAFSNMDA
jgi:hypothetical protein